MNDFGMSIHEFELLFSKKSFRGAEFELLLSKKSFLGAVLCSVVRSSFKEFDLTGKPLLQFKFVRGDTPNANELTSLKMIEQRSTIKNIR